jgi:hypothetical protein
MGQGLYVGHYGFGVIAPELALPTVITFGGVLAAAVVF